MRPFTFVLALLATVATATPQPGNERGCTTTIGRCTSTVTATSTKYTSCVISLNKTAPGLFICFFSLTTFDGQDNYKSPHHHGWDEYDDKHEDHYDHHSSNNH